MGYAVQVDPDVLAAGACRLALTAQTLDTLAGRVLALCDGAGAAAGGAELSAAVEGTGREAARAIGQGASAVGTLGARTACTGEEYRLLELALTSRLAPTAGAGPAAAGGDRVAEGAL